MAAAYTTGFLKPTMKVLPEPKDTDVVYNKKGVFNKVAFDKALANFRANSNAPAAVKYRTNELTKKYGKLTDDQGKPLFNATVLNDLASGTYRATYLDDKVKAWAENKIINSSNYADILKDKGKGGGINSIAYQGVLQSLMTDPLEAEKFTYPKTYTDKITTAAADIAGVDTAVDTAAESDAAEKAAADIATADALATATDKQKATKFGYTIPKLTAEEALASYNPDKGIWHGASTTNSPFGDTLQGLIAGYKNPYAPGNTNPTSSLSIDRQKPVIYHAPELTNNAAGGTNPYSSGKPATPVVPKVEAPPVVPKVEAPPVVPKVEAPPVVPKVETPPVVPKVETPPVVPKVETPKTVDVPTGIAALPVVTNPVEDPRWGGPAAQQVAYAQDWLKNNPNAPATSIANMKSLLENRQYAAQQQAAPTAAQQAAAQQQAQSDEWEYNGRKAREETAAWEKRLVAQQQADAAAQQAAQAAMQAPTGLTLTGPQPTSNTLDSLVGPVVPAQQQAQQAAAQQFSLTATQPQQQPTYSGIAAPTAAQQQQTVVETDAERIARQQASIAALEASYPQQFSLTATQPQQQYTLGPQVPQRTSLQTFADRAREINTIQNGFTSAADASAYEAAHPGYTTNVYTP